MHSMTCSLCDACGAGVTTQPTSEERHPVSHCASCGFRSIADPETVVDLSVEQTEEEYLASYSATLDGVARRRLSAVKAIQPPPARCLDFGASYGVIAEQLMRDGYAVSTFEKSQQALQSMRSRGLTAYDELEDLPANAFDIITAWHVLEHLSKPSAVLQILHKSLRPGGSIVIAVPNAEGFFARLSFEHWIWTMPWHLHYFSRTSLRRVLERSDFIIKSEGTGTGDPAALELLVGGVVLRAPSRLSRQTGLHGEDRNDSWIRGIGAPVLRTLSNPIQGAAQRLGAGEELIVHAVKA